MSWLDKIKDKLTITTGEGSSFTPNWIRASREREYNVTEFEFDQVKGTLVNRRQPKGMRYNLEIFFQGDNCIDDAQTFGLAADDPRPWTISHPFYGTILVQPLGLTFDNSVYNISKITGRIVETINEDNPQGSVDAADQISFDKSALDQVFVDSFGFGDPALAQNQNVNFLTANMQTVYKGGLPMIKLDVDASDYFNKFNAANAAILNIASDVFGAMNIVKDFINAPFQFTNSVKNRIAGLENQFNNLRDSINNLTATLFNKTSKKSYENNAGTVVSAMAMASVTNPDYKNRNDVLATMDSLLGVYNQYIADLDDFQDANGGNPDNYIPDANSIIGLNALINLTVSSLFTIALNSKQERAIYCETDTNAIVLAHRLYGLIPDDSTLETLIDTNSIGLNEILQIKKGRKIIWYV